VQKIVVLITALALLSGYLFPTPLAARPVLCDDKRAVQGRDTLSEISGWLTWVGSAITDIAAATDSTAAVDASCHSRAEAGKMQPDRKLHLAGAPNMPGPEVAAIAALTGSVATATPTRPADASVPVVPNALSADVLKNIAYKTQWTPSGTVQLKDGGYSAPETPGSASRLDVRLAPEIAYGVLNGEQAAAVVLVSTPGTSGTFYDLAVVVERHGKPVNINTAALGDRTRVKSLAIANNQVVVDMVRAGRNDPLCCPTEHTLQKFAVKDGNLVLTSTTVLGTV
jgi:hypothetical protein